MVHRFGEVVAAIVCCLEGGGDRFGQLGVLGDGKFFTIRFFGFYIKKKEKKVFR